MKTVTDLLLEAADAIDRISGLLTTEIVAVTVYEDFTTVHVNEAGVAKLSVVLGEPVVDPAGGRFWANPSVKRESWMSEGSFDYRREQWPGGVKLQAVAALPAEPATVEAEPVAEPKIAPVVLSDGTVLDDTSPF